MILEGIREHLVQYKSYGFKQTYPIDDLEDLQKLKVRTRWILGHEDGDGVVWPDAYGELVIKWSRPGCLGNFLRWSKRHSSDM